MEKREFTIAELSGPKNAMGYPEIIFKADHIEPKPNKPTSKRAPRK